MSEPSDRICELCGAEFRSTIVYQLCWDCQKARPWELVLKSQARIMKHIDERFSQLDLGGEDEFDEMKRKFDGLITKLSVVVNQHGNGNRTYERKRGKREAWT